MTTIAEQLQEAADKATQASEQGNLWATGPINTTVPTDSGPVPTIAEFTRAAQVRADAAIEALGWVLAGDFTAGCTVTERNQYVLVVGGPGYRWDGALPKDVAPGSSPTPIATGAWVLVGDATLRGDLAALGGAGLVDGLAKPVTWSGFAGGADPTGVTASDAAFAAANSTKRMVNVPAGTYLLNSDVVSDKDTTWRFEQGVRFIGTGRLRQVPWLVGLGGNIFHYLERTSRNTFIAPGDGTAVFGSAHTADGGAGGAALAVAGMAYNDDTSGSRSSVWGHYSTVVRGAAAIGASHGMEIDVANLGTNAEMFPASMFPNGQTDALWLASGGELTEAGVPVGNASAAIGVISNDTASNARFLKGIVFQNKSLLGTDGGSTGQAIAIAMANRHSLTWYNNSNQKTTEIFSTSEDNSKALRLNFSDFGASLQRTSGGKTVFNIETGASTPANYLTMRYGSAGNPVTVAAAGDDANVDILVSPKGTGGVAIGGNMPPQTANAYTVGTALRPWAGGFTQAAFTVTSDEKYKTKPLDIADAMLDAAAEVEWCMFQYLDRVEVKGEDSARWHFGAMAQQFVRAFKKHGLDPLRFAFICYDEWEDQFVRVQTNEGEMATKTRTVSRPVMIATTRDKLVDEVLEDGTKIKKVVKEDVLIPKLAQIYIFNEDGSPSLDDGGVRRFVMEPAMEDVVEEYTEPAPPVYVDVLEVAAGSRYGIRYDQAIILKQKQIERDHKRQIDALEARLATLEAK